MQAEPALQVNGPAGGIYRVLAQSELRSGYLHSDDFFFHLSNGKFLCDNLFLLLILACIPISALAITVHSAFKNPSLPCTRTSKS